MSLFFETKHFTALSNEELYYIIAARIEVFCVEQDCPYQDCDGRDINAYHIMGKDSDGIIHAYCRLLDKGVSYDGYASIGRVITDASYRGTGAGKQLMQYAIAQSKTIYPGLSIKISAQNYALPFYTALGFEAIGESYIEDDIPHTAMILPAI